MYYNLDLFGKEVRRIRNSLGLTQKYISTSTNINIDTLRKIENGKVIPKQETLDLISVALKKDLNKLLLEYRLDDYKKFNELKSKIEVKLESGNFKDLEIELNQLNDILSKDMNTYFYKLYKQLFLLIESVILKINHNDYKNALSKLVDSMQITTPDFSLSNYNDFVYNNMEIRILMNIALLLNKLVSKEKCLEMLLFCLNSLETEEIELRIKICYNLSYTYHRLNLNEQVLHYSSLGIDTCVKSNSLSCLGLLHYRKAIAEYHLEKDNYMNSLLKGISIFELTNQDDLKDMIVSSCEKFYNIEI